MENISKEGVVIIDGEGKKTVVRNLMKEFGHERKINKTNNSHVDHTENQAEQQTKREEELGETYVIEKESGSKRKEGTRIWTSRRNCGEHAEQDEEEAEDHEHEEDSQEEANTIQVREKEWCAKQLTMWATHRIGKEEE